MDSRLRRLDAPPGFSQVERWWVQEIDQQSCQRKKPRQIAGALERDTGVEPVSQPWEGWARPLYQSRIHENFTRPFGQRKWPLEKWARRYLPATRSSFASAVTGFPFSTMTARIVTVRVPFAPEFVARRIVNAPASSFATTVTASAVAVP